MDVNRHYVVIKKFNTFMYDHTLHLHFCCYSLQTFSTEKILKRHIKDCFEINSKQKNKMSKTDEYVKFKNYERKVKSPSVIHGGFERILVSEDNIYGYKLVCIDDKFSKSFKTYLDEDAVYNFINSMIEESKYYSDVMKKKRFNKELVMTKEDNEDFKNSAKCWICDNDYVDNDIKVKDHCHITDNIEVLDIEIAISILN